MAALQVSTLKNNNSSSMRTQATFLAEAMADRIRANPDAWDANSDGNYDDSLYIGQDTNTLGTDPGCVGSVCTPSQLVTHDVLQWAYGADGLEDKSDGIESLPSGRGQILFVPQVGAHPQNAFRIRVMWDDERTGAVGTGCSDDHSAAGDLTCFDLEFRL
jgi:type IV pilus assembly protein PilV